MPPDSAANLSQTSHKPGKVQKVLKLGDYIPVVPNLVHRLRKSKNNFRVWSLCPEKSEVLYFKIFCHEVYVKQKIINLWRCSVRGRGRGKCERLSRRENSTSISDPNPQKELLKHQRTIHVIRY